MVYLRPRCTISDKRRAFPFCGTDHPPHWETLLPASGLVPRNHKVSPLLSILSCALHSARAEIIERGEGYDRYWLVHNYRHIADITTVRHCLLINQCGLILHVSFIVYSLGLL